MTKRKISTNYKNCRFCGSKLLPPVIDLGSVPLAGGFLKTQNLFKNEKFYSLKLSFCDNCFLLQTKKVIDADTLFKNYFYHSSSIKTLIKHFEELSNECLSYISPKKNSVIVEIGCNDASFIKACLKKKFRTIGVDPATNIVAPLIKQGLPIINDYFTQNVTKRILSDYGKVDLIFSSNTFAHITDMHEVFTCVKNLLRDDGILIFEVHYLGNLIKDLQYDMIYHEHQYYYSLTTLIHFLKQFDMNIFDIKFIPIHAGSIRIYAQKSTGKRKKEKIVTNIIRKEKNDGLTSRKIFLEYDKRIKKTKKDLLQLLKHLKKQGRKIAGYGASGRGTIIMNYCGLTNQYLQYVIDDAPAKQGTYTPGNHLKILSSEILLDKKPPDFVILFAWSFWEEIKKRNQKYIDNGGKFIIPLPAVKQI